MRCERQRGPVREPKPRRRLPSPDQRLTRSRRWRRRRRPTLAFAEIAPGRRTACTSRAASGWSCSRGGIGASCREISTRRFRGATGRCMDLRRDARRRSAFRDTRAVKMGGAIDGEPFDGGARHTSAPGETRIVGAIATQAGDTLRGSAGQRRWGVRRCAGRCDARTMRGPAALLHSRECDSSR
jgi:hypothetical protein